MSRFVIKGGKPVSGVHRVPGNKNAALPMLAASLLTAEPVTLSNLPLIADVRTMLELLSDMGAEVEEMADGCVVRGKSKLRGARVSSLNDHRILMAAAVAALVAEGETIISDGDCHRISYPDFVQDMRSLGAKMEMIP